MPPPNRGQDLKFSYNAPHLYPFRRSCQNADLLAIQHQFLPPSETQS